MKVEVEQKTKKKDYGIIQLSTLQELDKHGAHSGSPRRIKIS